MKETIRFKGLSLNRDEQSAQHGELSLCGNVEIHDGAVRQYQMEGSVLASGQPLGGSNVGELLFIHQTASYTHYIYKVASDGHDIFKWTKEVPAGPSTSAMIWQSPNPFNGADSNLFYAENVVSIKAVGNTLCIMKSDGLHYVLFKNGGYEYLGTHPPFAELQFNLTPSGNGKNHDDVTIKVNSDGFIKKSSDDWIDTGQFNPNQDISILENQQATVTEQVMAAINERIDAISQDGLFYAPFLVRYCYRMYDGTSLIMHSSPVLMMPMIYKSVLVSLKEFLYTDTNASQSYFANWQDEFICRVFMNTGALQVEWLNGGINTELQKWSDIISSVDIFITPQFSGINTSDLIKSVKRDAETGTIQSLMGGEGADGSGHTISDLFNQAYPDEVPDERSFYNTYTLGLPRYTDAQIRERIRNAGQFYKIASYAIKELSNLIGSWNNVPIGVGSLVNIPTGELMTDDYKTHNTLRPDGSGSGGLYVYNHRLNVYGISEILFEGFSANVLFPYVKSTASGATAIYNVSTFISVDGTLKKVNKSCNNAYILTWLLSYYAFYPDSRATYMQFVVDQYTYYTKAMAGHPSLNGALINNENVDVATANRLYGMSVSNVAPISNKVYTSRADNPFYFPNLPGESGINTVGVGEIIGIAAVTRPLVQGEVGKQNLVVFATDGIWVLEVSSTGTYSNMRNISREVCVNKESICQMDQSILFATSRSLSRFVESDVVSLSNILDGPIFDVKTKMSAFYSLFSAGSGQRLLLDFNTPPLDFFKAGHELYDYVGMRVLVFPANVSQMGVSLCYSIRDEAWSTFVFSALKTVLNSYPFPYIEDANGVVYRLDKPYDYNDVVTTSNNVSVTQATPGIIVTRTLTFSDTMDVLRGFKQYFDGDASRMPLIYIYGSNDQRTWKLIGYTAKEYHNYLPGHPFRFFRIAMSLSLAASEEYQQLQLEVINKYAKL